MKSEIDQGEEYPTLSAENKQDYISLANVCFVKDDLISRNMVHIVLSDGNSRWQFEADDLNLAPYWSTPEVQTLMRGTLTMDFSIRTSEGVLVSTGSMSWPLKQDSRLSISITRGVHARPCFGCSGSKSFPIVNASYRDTERDAIFVQWGVNSISNPAHY